MKLIAQGIGANPGMAKGPAKLILTSKDVESVQKGDILVCQQTDPSFVITFGKISGVATERGGITAHAAIISRELGIPCVVGAKNICSLIKNGDQLVIDGSKGEVCLP